MLVATYSSIDTFRTCHRKYFYKYDELLKPKVMAWPLLDGKALHAGIEWLYNGRAEVYGPGMGVGSINGEKVPPQASNHLIWPRLDLYWPILEVMYEKERGLDNETSRYHLALTKAMLEGYVIAYQPDEFESFAPEVKGKVTVDNSYIDDGKFELAFKVDALVRKSGQPYLFETKSTSDNSIERFLSNLRLDDQSHTYLFGCNRLGNPAHGFIYNVVRKSKHKLNKGENEEHFHKRLRELYRQDASQEVEKRKYYFRETIYRGEKEHRQYQEEVRQVTSDMCNYMPYKSPKRCGDFSGCPFITLCEGADTLDMFIKKSAMHEELEDEK